MTVEDECLVLLAQAETELHRTLNTETQYVRNADKELGEVEEELEQIRVRLLEIEEDENPDMSEVEVLYQKYLKLSNRQSQLTDGLTIGIETIGICESALY